MIRHRGLLAVLPVLLGVAAVGLTSGWAAAQQTKPINNDDPYQRDSSYTDHSRSANNFGGYGGYEQGGYPASDMRIAVDANARAVWARLQYQRMQDTLNATIHTLTLQFESSAELKDAVNAEKQAYDSLLAARDSALQSVYADPKYQALMELRKSLAVQISERQEQRGIKAEDMMDLALTKLGYSAAITAMEIAVLDGDAKVKDAHDKLMVVGQRVAEVRAHFDTSVRTNPDVLALRRQIDDARIAYLTAAAFRDGAIDSANAALGYAYNQNRVNSNVGYSGYGVYSGYTSPFGYRY